MLRKGFFVFLAVLVFVVFEVGNVSASGRSPGGTHANGSSVAGCRTGNGNCWANSGQFSPAENGVSGSASSYGNGYGNWGGTGGYGQGYGYGYPGWGYSPFAYGYELEGVPYFAQFPPVYYGYEDNMPVVKPSIRSSWVNSESPQPVTESSVSVSPPSPPLRIVNPYYVEEKAGRP